MAQDYEIKVKVTGVDQAKTQVDGLSDSLKDAGQSSSQLSVLDKITGGAVSGFKNAAAGVQTFIAGLKLTRAAIIATGIGALVVGVTSLVAAFTSTRRGARQLQVIMAGLGAVVERVTAHFQAAGGFIVDLFSKGPTEAAKNYRAEVDKLPGSMSEAVRATMELQKAEQALLDTRRELTVADAAARESIAKDRLIARDRTKSIEERTAAAQRAMDTELELMAQRVKAAEEEFRIAEERSQMSDTGDEELQRLAELEANVINIRTQSFLTQRRLQEEIQSVEREATAERKAQEAERTKSREAEAKAAADAAAAIIKAEQDIVDELDKRSRASLSALEKELLAEEDIYNKMLDAAGENAELITRIEAQRDEAIQAIFAKHNAETIQKRDELNEALAARRMTEREKEIADHDKQFYELLAAAGTNQELRLAVMDQYATEVNEMQERHRQEDLDNERAAQRAKRDIVLNAAVETMSVLKNLNEAFSKGGAAENKKAFERNKAISIAETLVSTYMAAQKAFTSQLTATPDSPIRAALAAAAATASGLARVAAIKRTQFNEGGGGGAAAGGSAGGIGGSTRSIGVDVGTLIPNQDTPTPEPVRAYVVENEISNKQALNRELQIQTTL